LDIGLIDKRSLAIRLSSDYFPFELDFLLEPRKYSSPAVRVYVHETLHFWQILSQGYIANLALDEWLQLKEYEKNCRIPEIASLSSRFRHKHESIGFSAWNLSEALCRYWDIHILGSNLLLRKHLIVEEEREDPSLDEHPLFSRYSGSTSLTFDALMNREDAYAEPYRIALKNWGTNNSVILFPIVGHLALQTPKPIEVFIDVVERLVGSYDIESSELDIHQKWREIFDEVYKECIVSTVKICNLAELTPGWDVIDRSELNQHPIYSHYLDIMKFIFNVWKANTHFFFALPGDPYCRMKLASTFRPPITLFNDGEWHSDTHFLKTYYDGMAHQSNMQSGETLAKWSKDILSRSRKMQQRIRLYNLVNNT
jgi:hypothetical protein